jgi:hypothetical protein
MTASISTARGIAIVNLWAMITVKASRGRWKRMLKKSTSPGDQGSGPDPYFHQWHAETK